MADPSVGCCGRLSPCPRVQPWPPAGQAGELPPPPPPPPPLPESDSDPAIERLLALYSGGSDTHTLLEDDADASQSSSASEEILSNQDLTLDKALIGRELLGECDPPDDGDDEPPAKRPCLASVADEPADDTVWRKTASVGPEFQAELPALRPAAHRRRSRPDRLVWDPSRLPEHEVERYQRRLRPAVVSAAPPPAAPRPARRQPDHEQALRHLQESGHDVEEAARRVSSEPPRPAGRLDHWSDHECTLFEQALRLHGKDFGTIQRQMLPTRSVGEIVNFYYLWKKTERHRQFLSLTQFDRRKYGAEPALSEPCPRMLSAAASSLQILMATDPWEHGPWAAAGDPQPSAQQPQPPPAGLASLLASCPQLLLP
ncbi:Mesoderm induction early response protein 1 [Amphibalanus amphitrite]|uniref:Mesoderm induction early response protein 1 n=1 Tax=Amphibalanus amphitrite TaxID=1232801 RepID=A0A6A4VYH1_AMPAM|nr:Mesoderm induction early response protein 1 [Amphibalanus amphitrite]